MCNACGYYCCGSDELGGCGCDGCYEPDCWFDDEDEDFDDDGYELRRCCAPREARFVCEEPPR